MFSPVFTASCTFGFLHAYISCGGSSTFLKNRPNKMKMCRRQKKDKVMLLSFVGVHRQISIVFGTIEPNNHDQLFRTTCDQDLSGKSKSLLLN